MIVEGRNRRFMKIQRSKNARRNIFFGILLKIYQQLIPFVFHTIILYTLGVDYLGLNSLFTSILQVLNLAELGVGSAMVFSMYKPIIEEDTETICALMRLYKIYYRIIGIVVFFVGILLMPFIPKLINGEVPSDINVYILYLLNLVATALTYWLFAYKNSILQAYQRNDIGSKVMICTDTLKYGLQLIALYIFHNYYYYVLCVLLAQILTNILTAVISDKMYAQYKPKGKLPKEDVKKINGRIRDLFTSKLGGTIVGSADTVVISAFLGLEVLAIYQNYYYIVSAVMAFVFVAYNSITAGVGNSILTKDKEEFYQDFRTVSFMQSWLIGVCICCFCGLFQPFMKLWMGKDMLLPYPIVILLCIYFWGYEMVQFLSVYKDAGGIWHQDRFRPLLSGIFNLIINIILVKSMGLYGIILSTIISVYFVSIPWIIHNVFKFIFKRDMVTYILYLIKSIGAICVAIVVCIILCSYMRFTGIVQLVINGIICFTVPSIVYILLYRKSNEMQYSLKMIKRMFGRK